MKAFNPLRLVALLLGVLLGSARAEEPKLDSHLEPLRPLLEKTWKGTFKNATTDHPVVDVARWERALNGKAVRVQHSINEGVYGGETLIQWDEKKQSLVYHYFTTAGFSTTGTMKIEGTKVTSLEEVSGDAGGVTKVRATSEIRADGTFSVKAEYYKNGEWSLGHEADYHADPAAKVVFQ